MNQTEIDELSEMLRQTHISDNDVRDRANLQLKQVCFLFDPGHTYLYI